MSDILAIVVARKGSIRVKNKALQKINGKTLLEHKIDQLKKCQKINRVVVGSDCEEILDLARKAGVEAVRRPDYFCDESVCSANEMIKNMCELVEADVIVWAHCTNPLISPQTYDNAVEAFFEAEKKSFDSLLSVLEVREHLWTTDKKPLNYDPYLPKHTLARDLPVLYKQDGGIFIQRHSNMLANAYFFGDKPYLYIMPSEEELDINTTKDLKQADLWLQAEAF